jgi:ketosteroid isomerase-like protein
MLRSALAAMALAAAPGLATAGDREDLLALEARWNRAVWEKDVAALKGILADDFVIIAGKGATGGKAELLQAIASPRATTQPFETEQVQVRVWGDAAVLTGRFTQTATVDGKAATTTYRYTDVYIRGPAGWRAVSAQATEVPAKPAAG